MGRRVPASLLLTGVFLVAGARGVLALDRVTCETIRTDETVASVARRLTGDPRNMHEPWFQIVNPITSRAVPKTRYGFIFAGWKACTTVPERRPEPRLEPVARVVPASIVIDPPPLRRATTAWPNTALSVTAAASGLLVLGIAFTCWLVDERLARRQRTLRAMQAYAERFVEAFERPLHQPHLGHRPIQSRVRFKPGRARFDVMLAPEGALRYPNLADHKKNVMYDVLRIQRALSEHAFVSSRPYARGRWVVVPFRFRTETKEGGQCDSFS